MSDHTAAAPAASPPRHTVVVRLHDRPGALYRAVGLIRRRGYNVASLVVGASERPGTSRMVLVVEACDVRQVIAQLRRLIDVLSVQEIDAQPAHVDEFVESMLRFDAPDEPTNSRSHLTPQETAR
jgi:acetolactate synthase-1/3 small subunit